MNSRLLLMWAVSLVSLSTITNAQQIQWQREDKTDPLRGTAYAQFMLTGTFLTPPKIPPSGKPMFIMKCKPDDHHRAGTGWEYGKLMEAYIIVHAVVNHDIGHIAAQYRLDDSKIHKLDWRVSTDGTAIFPDRIGLNDLFYGHLLQHKEGTGAPVHKAIISVNEYLGAEIVVQFDMPDPTEVADACGLIIHKHKD